MCILKAVLSCMYVCAGIRVLSRVCSHVCTPSFLRSHLCVLTCVLCSACSLIACVTYVCFHACVHVVRSHMSALMCMCSRAKEVRLFTLFLFNTVWALLLGQVAFCHQEIGKFVFRIQWQTWHTFLATLLTSRCKNKTMKLLVGPFTEQRLVHTASMNEGIRAGNYIYLSCMLCVYRHSRTKGSSSTGDQTKQVPC